MAILPYKYLSQGKKRQVTLMFDNIAGHYDLLNHLLSFNIDKYWRRKAIGMLKSSQPMNLLDVATGTGDFAVSALKLNPSKIIGVDLSEGMLEIGKNKCANMKLSGKIEFQLADAESLPFENECFNAVISGFGVRNFENLGEGINETFRVLQSGGQILILEFSMPKSRIVKLIYRVYFKFVLPVVGRLISKDKSAYSYLPDSVSVFPEGKAFLDILRSAGYINCTATPVSFGIASIYTGFKP